MPVGEHEIGEQPDVGVHRDPAAVGRLRGHVLEALELAVEGAVLAVDPLVLARHVGGRIHVHDPRVAVDDQLVALVHGLGQMLDADHGGDLERLGENRGMRRDAAGGEHDGAQVLVLDHRQVGERQLLGHQHAVLRERMLGLLDAEEVAEDA